jgi:hypothetical protein
VSRNSENLNLLEPEGAVKACIGIPLPLPKSGTENKGDM